MTGSATSSCLLKLLAATDTTSARDTILIFDDVDVSRNALIKSIEKETARLQSLGVTTGSRVAVLAENSVSNVVTWLSLNALGAVDIPINTSARAPQIQTMLAQSHSDLVLASRALMNRAAEAAPMLDREEIAAPVPLNDDGRETDRSEYHRLGAGDPGRLATLMFTSGTTGPSKAVMLPADYYAAYGFLLARILRMTPGERLLCAQPLFHIDARLAVAAAICSQSTAVLTTKFSARQFWPLARRTNATRMMYIGSMLWILSKQPRSYLDTLNKVQIALGSATPPELWRQFERRFDLRLVEAYGQTEAALITHTDLDEPAIGSVGRPHDRFCLYIRGEDDEDQAVGEVGEIVAEPLEGGYASIGYDGEPAVASRRLLRTGDSGFLDADGNLHFVGRLSDSMRRRGENVSAWEVEQVFLSHPAVVDCAAFGVPSDLGEEDIALLVVLNPEIDVSERELAQYAAERMAYYMVPRYIELVADLPRTPSERVAKAEVRARGVTSAAWDGVAHGFSPK